MIEVPVTIGFDGAKIIGTLRVDESMLPALPRYVFALGVKALELDCEESEAGTMTHQTMRHVTKYELCEVGLVSDDRYKQFLDLQEDQ